MAPNPKGPKQQKKPNLPLGPKQPYGEPISGSKRERIANRSGQNSKTHHDM